MILVSLCAETIKPVFEGDKICQYIMYRYDNIRNNYSIIKCPIPCTILVQTNARSPPLLLLFLLSCSSACRITIFVACTCYNSVLAMPGRRYQTHVMYQVFVLGRVYHYTSMLLFFGLQHVALRSRVRLTRASDVGFELEFVFEKGCSCLPCLLYSCLPCLLTCCFI